ncbi:MAG TPA: sigma 54-interacting transcriptional regulator [Polyangiaceae bacterium]
MSPPRLELVAFWRDEMKSFELPAAGQVTIGRAEECQVRIEHPSVSRRHALLTLGAESRIEDLGGANGTFVRDRSDAENLGKTHTMRRLARASADVTIGESVMVGEVTILLRRAAEAPSEFGDLGAGPSSTPGVVIQNPKMREVYAQAERAAQSSISVLILGETGVGKDLLARAIHARSPRAEAPFLSLNCAALSESLLESEIFGYERGAFTGAVQARPGLFESADGGSVFLDEIGELSPTTQAKLLRVLEERSVRRLGALQPRAIDVRFLAATNRDLEAEAEVGRFRPDLYFRVAGLSLTLPPLRERPEEIEPLVSAFLAAAIRQLDRKERLSVSDEAMAVLKAYPWRGNVRELKNVVERAVILCVERSIQPDHLPAELLRAARAVAVQTPGTPAAGAPNRPESGSFHADLKAFERERLLEALDRCGGNQTRAAELLGISRRTLVSRLSEFGLPRPRKRLPE